ncbi:MAG: copper oxidase [Pseudomonadota bacterium]
MSIGLGLLVTLCCQPLAEHHHHHHHHEMTMDRYGMVMHENHDQLPSDCSEISERVRLEVVVGRKFAAPGRTFGFNQHVWQVPPCSQVSVSFTNDDEVRHQWMVHGLPRYLYPQGMFHMEVNGGHQKEGVFIVPSGRATYLVHCDISHHMEQGLKGQLVIGEGSGNLPSIPGLTGPRFRDQDGSQQ